MSQPRKFRMNAEVFSLQEGQSGLCFTRLTLRGPLLLKLAHTANLWTSERPGSAMDDSPVRGEEPRLLLKFPYEVGMPAPTRGITTRVASDDSPGQHQAQHVCAHVRERLAQLRGLCIRNDDSTVDAMILSVAAVLPRDGNALSSGDEDDPSPFAPAVRHVFPRLKVIEIQDAVFHARSQQDSKSPSFLKLITCLRSRAAHGYKLKKLKLTRAVICRKTASWRCSSM
ncbi:hypothetical protein NM688_g2420 [Phlebia brevispora]|uniref:Uncharacterized protein n=1 Tax=Phlebia brevispora TaxID=194682 RepID=A0ACC1T8F6_9APHY|nr:hypothetical protein NM688_g2420 [Phlebia brevispora]